MVHATFGQKIVIGAIAALLLGASAVADDQRVQQAASWLERADRLLERGEQRGAAEAYWQAAWLDPDADEAYRRATLLYDRLGPAATDAQRDRLAREFEAGTYLRQSRHYLMVYDGPHAWADTRVNLLEMAEANFYRRLREAGLRPLPLRRPLEVVLFSEHADFADYAGRVDQLDRSWAAGYYSSRSNRIVMFNYHTSPVLEKLVVQMRKAEGEVQRWQSEVGYDRRARGRLAAAQRQLATVRQRYETIAAWGNIQQTLHEAAHQLAFNSGIQRRGVQYPMWFSEGLATAFETTHPATGYGPHRINDQRRQQLRQLGRKNALLPLDRLVALTLPPDHDRQRDAAYAQSWALFHYLFNHRSDQLARYVRYMAAQSPGKRDADQLRADFEQAFGPVEQVRDAYDRHVAELLDR